MQIITVAKGVTSELQTIAAAEAIARDGDLIDVQPGIYAEALQAMKTGVGYRGQPGAIIRPPVGSARCITMANGQSDIVVSGFILDAKNCVYDVVKLTYSAGEEIDAVRRIYLSDMELYNAPGQGILLTGGVEDCTLVRLRIHNNGKTPELCHGVYCAAKRTIMTELDLYANMGLGIQMYKSPAGGVDGNILKNSRIHGNSTNSVWAQAVVVQGGEGNQVIDNLIYDHKYGIDVFDNSKSAFIARNTIVGAQVPINIKPGAVGTTRSVDNIIV